MSDVNIGDAQKSVELLREKSVSLSKTADRLSKLEEELGNLGATTKDAAISLESLRSVISNYESKFETLGTNLATVIQVKMAESSGETTTRIKDLSEDIKNLSSVQNEAINNIAEVTLLTKSLDKNVKIMSSAQEAFDAKLLKFESSIKDARKASRLGNVMGFFILACVIFLLYKQHM